MTTDHSVTTQFPSKLLLGVTVLRAKSSYGMLIIHSTPSREESISVRYLTRYPPSIAVDLCIFTQRNFNPSAMPDGISDHDPIASSAIALVFPPKTLVDARTITS